MPLSTWCLPGDKISFGYSYEALPSHRIVDLIFKFVSLEIGKEMNHSPDLVLFLLQLENGSDSQSVQSMASSAASNEGGSGRSSGGGGSDGTKGDGGGKIKKKFRKGKQDKKAKDSSNVSL